MAKRRTTLATRCGIDQRARPNSETLFDMLEDLIDDAALGKRSGIDPELSVQLCNLQNWLDDDCLLTKTGAAQIRKMGSPRAVVIANALSALPKDRVDALIAALEKKPLRHCSPEE